MRLGQFALGSALVFVVTGVSNAQDVDITMRDDVRCVVATSLLLKTMTDPTSEAILQTALLYYVGRIEGRDPALDLNSAMKQEIPYVATVGANKEFDRCANGLATKMKILADLL